MQLHKVSITGAVLGSFVAAMLSAISFAILTPLNETRTISAMLASLFVYVPYCLYGEALIGLPIFLAMLKMNAVRWWLWLPLSFGLGMALGVLAGNDPSRDVTPFIATVSVSVISALVLRLTLAISNQSQNKVS